MREIKKKSRKYTNIQNGDYRNYTMVKKKFRARSQKYKKNEAKKCLNKKKKGKNGKNKGHFILSS